MKNLIYKLINKIYQRVAPEEVLHPKYPIIRSFHNQSNEDLIIQSLADMVNLNDLEDIKSIKLTYTFENGDHQREMEFSK